MRILGLDIGSSSIKAIEIDSAFRRFEVHDHHQVPINPETGVADALAQLFSQLTRRPDRVSVVLPSSLVTFRNLKIPTRDRKLLQSSLAFELEDELPFELDQAVFDYAILAQVQGVSQIHVAATLREPFQIWLDVIRSAGVEPNLVTSESWAFRTLMNRVIPAEQQERPLLLIQMGERRTHLYVHHRGNPVIAREIPWGGWDMVHALTEGMGISEVEAERVIRESGGIIFEEADASHSASQKDVSARLIQSLTELTRELRQIHFATKNLTGQALGQAMMSGGRSLLPGIKESLEKVLRIPVSDLKLLSLLSSTGVAYSPESDALFAPAAAAALCLAPQDKIRPINFRKGEFAIKKIEANYELKAYRRPLIAVAAIYACMMASFLTQKFYYQSKMEALDTQLERSIKNIFVNLPSKTLKIYLATPAKLKEALDKELANQRELARLFANTSKAPLGFLKEISSQFPKDLVVDVTHFQVGAAPDSTYSPDAAHTLEIALLLKDAAQASRLTPLFSKMLDGTKISEAEEAKSLDGKSKAYKVTITGTPQGGAYGGK